MQLCDLSLSNDMAQSGSVPAWVGEGSVLLGWTTAPDVSVFCFGPG